MEALQAVAGFAPDIILLDVMMPGMDGIQTYQALRRLPECAATPVVFMTAKVQAGKCGTTLIWVLRELSQTVRSHDLGRRCEYHLEQL
jgi:CheY-like chemotaxis protein